MPRCTQTQHKHTNRPLSDLTLAYQTLNAYSLLLTELKHPFVPRALIFMCVVITKAITVAKRCIDTIDGPTPVARSYAAVRVALSFLKNIYNTCACA